jgi:hypothetical protein
MYLPSLRTLPLASLPPFFSLPQLGQGSLIVHPWGRGFASPVPRLETATKARIRFAGKWLFARSQFHVLKAQFILSLFALCFAPQTLGVEFFFAGEQ